MLWTSYSGFFGGRKYFKAHGIDSYKKATIASLCPGQVYFRKNVNARKKALKNLLKIAGYFGMGHVLSRIIHSGLISMEFIEGNTILYFETLGFMVSILAVGNNIPANLHYLIFG